MKLSGSILVVGWLVTTVAMGADIGSVTFDIKSGGLDSIAIASGTTAVPVELYFSAGTAGGDGSNSGVQGVGMDLTGSAIAGVLQSSATADLTFIGAVSSGGLGFDLLGGAGGTGGVGIVSGIGDAQALPGEWDPLEDAANVGHGGNVLVATAISCIWTWLTRRGRWWKSTRPAGGFWTRPRSGSDVPRP